MERLIIHPAATPGRFIVILEKDGTTVTVSDQPLADGARVLLLRGFSPETMITMSHAGSGRDSFEPLSIGEWATVTYSERKKGTVARERWMPFPTPGEAQK
jgi:hypothetical protein